MQKEITYAHRNDPNGTRYRAMATDTPPVWAVDVRLDDGQMNQCGLPVHPTDDLIHWSDVDPTNKMRTLRQAYDKIVDAGLLADFELLRSTIVANEQLENN